MQKSEKYNGFLPYIIFNVIGFTIIYVPILVSGKMYMYIDIGADTYGSYWPSMSYAASIIGDMKLWDTSLGLGASTLTQISYFLIDPFNWIVFVFSSYSMDIGIFLSLGLKYVFLIIGSYFYYDIMGLKGFPRSIAALCTVFCGWFVGWGQHYNFASMFVMFVWMLYFFERWIRQKKWVGYVLILAGMSAMTVYYTYMSLLFLAVYYLIRYGIEFGYSDIKKFLSFSVKTILICIMGIALAAIIFVPIIGDITASPRVSGRLRPSLSFVSIKEYASLILRSFSSNILGINQNFEGYANYYECPFMYVSLLLFFFLPSIIKTRRNIVGYIMVAFALIFPGFVGIVFNAFSAIAYRWTYILVPIWAFWIGKGVAIWKENNCELKTSKWSYAFIMCSIVVYCCYLMGREATEIDRVVVISIIIVMGTATLYFFIFNNPMLRKRGEVFVCIVLLGELAANGAVSVRGRSLIEQTAKESMNYFDASQELIQYLKKNDSEFYRINKKYAQIDLNDSMIQHYTGEKFYCSTLTPSYWRMQELFDLRVKYSNYFYGFDDKQFLRDINCGKYMFTSKDRDYYGFEKIYEYNGRYLYRNLNLTGFGFLYDNYISESDYTALTPLQKQDVLYSAAIIADEDLDKVSDEVVARKEYISAKLSPIDSEMILDQSGITITLNDGNRKPLLVEIMGGPEGGILGNLYTSIKGEDYNIDDPISISIDAGVSKYYNIIDLDVEQIRLDISPDYVSSICIYEKDNTLIEDEIKKKSNNCLNIVEWSDEYIKGNIEIDRTAILYIPIIYDTKWKAYVNGVESEIIRTNGGFSSVVLTEGNNEIEFIYKNTGFIVGIIVSSITLVMIIGFAIYQRRLKFAVNSKRDVEMEQNI